MIKTVEQTHMEEVQQADHKIRIFNNEMAKLNESFKFIQITQVKVIIKDMTVVNKKRWWQLWKK